VSTNPRPVLWGVLNVTPDSFSDGGDYLETEVALAHAREMVKAGATVVDVGGESTRPGAPRVEPRLEQQRVLPILQALKSEGFTLSIDTMNASTASAAIAAGVSYVNDVSGGLADPDMFSVVAGSSVEYVLMHWRGHSDQMDSLANYQDVAREVSEELRERVESAEACGIVSQRIILDPGLGFAKTPQQNWELLAGFRHYAQLGHRVLVGASRKRFLGELLTPGHQPAERDAVSATLGVLLAHKGVWGLRVHNPRAHSEALDVWQSLSQGGVAWSM
jgi:dihydropteroate synthase